MSLTSYRFEFEDSDVAELLARVRAARFTTASGKPAWRAGTDPVFLRRLAAYWGTEFDWHAQLAKVNDVPQFVHRDENSNVLHFARLRSRAAGSAIPVLLLHGWPSTFLEMVPLAHSLSSDRDVVIPSLPGFLSSDLTGPPLTRRSMAARVHAAMVALGHDRYAVFGGDVGGLVAQWLAVDHPDHIAGLHLIHPPFPAQWDGDLTPEEASFLRRDDVYDETDGGYSAIMGTRPDTLSAALVDSPIGLAAWIADKWRDWSDCHGVLETRFSLEDVAMAASLYWLTDSVGSSMRQYFDYEHNQPRPRIDVPVAVTLSSEPAMRDLPRSIADRACSNVVSWVAAPRGGHFLAHEEPEYTAAQLRAALAAFEHRSGR